MNKTQEVTYFALNNELNRPVDGKIPLHKDREAVRAFFLEHVNPNTVFFYTFLRVIGVNEVYNLLFIFLSALSLLRSRIFRKIQPQIR